ncbi:MAG: ABC transporter substrate-binding protein, partial [Clostridia bacterium]|nr:ABC transporter substrate-binding protein [Clostridia bacterium]
NDYLTEKFNATLKMYKNDNNTHLEKLQMMVAGGQKYDLAFISNQYGNYVAQEAFYPLTDLLNEYGQDILAIYPKALWDCVTIGGEKYAIVTHKYSCDYFYYGISVTQSDAVGVSTDWVTDESLDRDGRWAAFLNWIKEMKAAGGDTNGYVTGMGTGPFGSLYPIDAMTGSATDPGAVIIGDDSFSNQEPNVVFNQFATPEFANYCAQVRELFNLGCLPIDPSTSVTWANGDPAVSTQDSMAKRLPGYEITYAQHFLEYRPNYSFTNTQKLYGSMNAIGADSGDPARVMMFLNELIANTEFANMIFYGLEDISYTRNEEGQIEKNTDEWNMTTWSLPGFCTAEPDTTLPINMNEMYEAFDKELVYSNNIGFVFDENPILAELSGIRQITKEYLDPLTKGLADPETELPKFLDALNAAGVDTVLAEEQAQLSAWRTAEGRD